MLGHLRTDWGSCISYQDPDFRLYTEWSIAIVEIPVLIEKQKYIYTQMLNKYRTKNPYHSSV